MHGGPRLFLETVSVPRARGIEAVPTSDDFERLRTGDLTMGRKRGAAGW